MTILDDASALSEPEPPPAAEPAEETPAPLLPVIADGTVRPLSPKAVRVEQIAGWVVSGIVSLSLMIGVVIVSLIDAPPGWVKGLVIVVWVLVSVALGILSSRLPVAQHRHTAYRVDGVGIEIRRGILWRKVLSVPRSRVQHIDVSQGPLERANGLGTLVLYTAGTAHARVELSGLEHTTAVEIRDYLLPKAGDDAV